jgi:hypothetical protein
VTKSLALLAAGTVGLWLVLAYPVWLIWGWPAVLFSVTAGLLCYVPTSLTLIWCRWAFKEQPEHQLLAVMGGTGVRLLFVLGPGIALFFLVPIYKSPSFWIWIVVFYLYTLTLEMVLLTRPTVQEQNPEK